jgi:quinone-modifying oxidoreductase subunit QmoB
VIGGGITGMSAAIDAAKAGYEVTIVEKSRPGRHAAKVAKATARIGPTPMMPDSPVVAAKIAGGGQPNITVKTETVVARIAGQPGEFTVTLKKPGEKIPFDVPFPLPEEMKVDENGKELDAEKQHEAYLEYNEGKKRHPEAGSGRRTVRCRDPGCRLAPLRTQSEGEFAHLGYGELPDVVTNHQFEEIAKAGKIIRPSDGKEAKSVVFVQSPGRAATATSPMPARSPAWWP